MSHNPAFHFDLKARAQEAMREDGFEPAFPQAALQQLQQIEHSAQPNGLNGSSRDLRALLWSSIDNQGSRDLDQVEFAEELPSGDIHVRVGIADVDSYVPQGSPIDNHAAGNATTVYTGIETFPMLPEPLSTGLTSLLQDEDRQAMVIDMIVDTNGIVTSGEVYRAVVRNYARLAYDPVGAWLEGRAPVPPGIAQIPGMDAQIRLQHKVARRLHTQRQQRGALDFENIEAAPVVEDGRVVDLVVPRKSAARYLIEDFMIAANSALAHFLVQTGRVSIQRVVRSPERWPRIVEIAQRNGDQLPAEPDAQALSAFLKRRKAADPAHFPDLSLAIVKLLGPGEYTVVRSPDEQRGHFGLAVYSYSHSTAPNRRFADLVTQRLLKTAITSSTDPYPQAELERIAQHCTERENAARKVERLMRKVLAAALLQDRIGEEFDAIVTGASAKGTYVRVFGPPVEGRVVQGEQGMDVGDHVRVRLIAADPERGFIDFANAEDR